MDHKWIEDHSNTVGNDLTDLLTKMGTKEALEDPEPGIPITHYYR